VGIDQGWDYSPGESVIDEVRKMAEKTRQWEYTLAKNFMQGVPEGVRDQLARSYRSLPSVADDVRRYAQRVIEGRTELDIPPYLTMGLLTADDAAAVQAAKGTAVAGYDYAVDSSAVRHIQAKHGSAAEELRGQKPVAAGDFARVPLIVNDPDTIEDAGMSDIGRPVVRYVKTIDKTQYTAVFEIRGGRGMLALISLWVNK